MALRSWNRLHPGESYWPISFELALTIAVWLLAQGWAEAAAGVLVAHRALLRVGELLRLRVRDILFLGEGALRREAVLRLEHTKTGQDQPVRVDDVGIVWLLEELLLLVLQRVGCATLELLCERHGDEFLLSLSYARLRAQFRSALTHFQLGGGRIVFHSLRHGGATELYLKGWTLDAIAHAGRWRSLTTARRYVSTGVALLTQSRVRGSVATQAHRLMRTWPRRLHLSRRGA